MILNIELPLLETVWMVAMFPNNHEANFTELLNFHKKENALGALGAIPATGQE